jgi:hypothetical protein
LHNKSRAITISSADCSLQYATLTLFGFSFLWQDAQEIEEQEEGYQEDSGKYGPKRQREERDEELVDEINKWTQALRVKRGCSEFLGKSDLEES